MTAFSQNGWQANDRSLITSIDVPGGKLAVRSGDVAVVFAWLARRFNDDVEPLEWPGCWGYAERLIRGGVSVSNHASGTAVDFNAPKHPLGRAGTFTPAQVRAIRAILADAHGGVIRWGGDYTGRKDEMHFEINASAAAVADLARTLEDDMPTLDEIAHAVWAYDQGGKKRQAWGYLQTAAADQAPKIAAAVKAQLPTAGAPTQQQLEDALRAVLGSLDES